MKILVTGASGLVGSAFARLAAAQGHEVIGVVGRWSENVPGTSGVLARDVAQPGVASDLIRGIRPAVIVNAAALAEPAACDAAPELSQRVNVDFPAQLAAAAAAAHARLLHLSSEQVFDGEQAPYSPLDALKPLNLYGRQKRASEERVLAASPASAVVRIPLLIGNSLTTRRSVHEKLFELWQSGQAARLYTDEIRQVCSAESVATMLLALAGRPDLAGVFHWAGAEPLSRHELGRRIAARFGVSAQWIVAVQRRDTPAVSAQRARDLRLSTELLKRELGLSPEWPDDAIAQLQRPAWARDLPAR